MDAKLKEEMENFDWSKVISIIENPELIVEEYEASLSQEKEDWYQKSIFSKKWAKTYKEAVEKTVAEYKDAKERKEGWASRSYRSAGKSSVFVSGELDDGYFSIDYINAKRKAGAIKAHERTMEEAVETLKELEVSQSEINNLLK